MTRTANGAQRSGAAVLTLVFTRSREDYRLPVDYFASSFFCVAPTPARWLRKQLRAGWPGGSPPGSLVLYGPGGRTAKRLKSNGSAVLFRTLTRDACAGVCGRTRIENLQNHRTPEPEVKTYVSKWVIGSEAVLSRFCGSASFARAERKASVLNGLGGVGPNKEWGGYSPRRVAGRIGAYPGLDTGAGPRNFRRQARAAGAIGVGGGVGQAAGGNGGNPPFFEVAAGRVGTSMLECRAETTVFCGLRGGVHQPAGLAAVDLGGAPTPPGGDAGCQGGTPPSRPRDLSRPLAQPIFWVSGASRIRRAPSGRVDRDGPVSLKPETGSGVGDLGRLSAAGRASAVEWERQQRVGVQGAILSRGRSRKPATLWGGETRVN